MLYKVKKKIASLNTKTVQLLKIENEQKSNQDLKKNYLNR